MVTMVDFETVTDGFSKTVMMVDFEDGGDDGF